MTIQPTSTSQSQSHSPTSLPPPSLHLPPIKSLILHSPDAEELHGYLRYLQRIYKPSIRGSKRRFRFHAGDSHSHSHSHSFPISTSTPSTSASTSTSIPISSTNTDLDTLRQDPFERTYALRWLTALIRTSSQSKSKSQESLIADAAALLAVCSGTSGAGRIVREYEIEVFIPEEEEEGGSSRLGTGTGLGLDLAVARIPTTTTTTTIRISITDVPLENADFGSVGAQTWGGACVLSEEIAKYPHNFFPDLSPDPLPDPPSSSTGSEFRVLELGAGTGLVSLTIGKVGEVLRKKMKILATDYYPSVLSNLKENIRVNFPCEFESESEGLVSISSHFLDWASFASTSTSTLTSTSTSSTPASSQDADGARGPLDSPFDLILGADIVYEDKHAEWIKRCVEKLLRRRDGNARFHLVIPLRRLFEAESGSVERVFGFSESELEEVVDAGEEMEEEEGEGEGEDKAQAQEVVIYSKEIIVCDAEYGSEKEDEVVKYAYYVIGWGN